MDEPDISILIATRNRSGMLVGCIDSLLEQKSDVQHEIVVLDQSDASEKLPLWVDNSRVKIVRCDFKNKSRALNHGVDVARSNHIAVVDDDCVVRKRWIDSMHLNLLEHPDAVITGRVVAGDMERGAVRSRLHDNVAEWTVYRKGSITPIFKLSGCNFGFTKRTYRAVGPFDTDFGPGSPFRSSDDNEWSYRVLRKGFEVIYDPRAVVSHRSWRSKIEDRRLMQDYGYAAGAFFGLIAAVSKCDFFYHSFHLWRWLLSAILFSFSIQEIQNHFLYGLGFVKGFCVHVFYGGGRK